ncbi:signal peptidase II [Moraxella cuniculi]|uniref:signal peptidase II n=1 Tax=Moraxella cuniculi TaxID=34061 RepID=UPI000993659F|nr:signal peptidase II [Moraxella cuniculi]OOS03652.1 signal peptidase II [Moraxella cuniculi]
MPKTHPLAPNGNTAFIYYGIGLLVLAFDQFIKHYFDNKLALGESISVIEPVLNWTLAYNYGAAFSFLADAGGWQKWFFIILGIVVTAYIVIYLRQIPKTAKVLSLGLAGVLGGALGNVIDRAVHGYVIDFIHVHYANVWNYPIFNTADIGICVGMALVIYDMLFLEKKRLPTG